MLYSMPIRSESYAPNFDGVLRDLVPFLNKVKDLAAAATLGDAQTI